MAQSINESVYRIDSFSVPQEARTAFMSQLAETQQFLTTQAGCLQNLVLEHASGADRFNMVTVVQWASPEAFAQAKEAMMAARRASGFDAQGFMQKLGVEANMANYVTARQASDQSLPWGYSSPISR
ncbi:antibiotic biosynthesis monooxygenase [Devosia sp.]|uniref:antibiotic biosynthesis monooxygenase n=1 Tax=Devosia sp. TaxID=1871048 RepID=UPI002732353C|nr:antibiotic biosynthesis monooxygenase [Devosia sp.]MDP2781605.1 antibiotic biosynthesis monooxygenase [Devosia sp.]